MGTLYRIMTAMTPVVEGENKSSVNYVKPERPYIAGDAKNGANGARRADGARKNNGQVEPDPDKPRSILETQLGELAELLERSKIPYWVDSGTLLGLIRENGFIEWDKDIDLSIWADDLPRLRSLWSEFTRMGYDPWPLCTGPPHVLSLVPKGDKERISVNIGGYHRQDDMTYRMVWDVRKNPFPRMDVRRWLSETYRFPLHATVFLMRSRFGAKPLVGKWPWTHIIEPGYWEVPRHYLEETKMHPSGFRIPVKAEEYLELRYGNWRIPVKDWDYKRDDGAYRAGVPPGIR